MSIYDPSDDDSRERLDLPRPLNGCMCQGGECESCNRVGEAFTVMRRALRTISYQTCNHGPQDICPREEAKAALAMADKVKP